MHYLMPPVFKFPLPCYSDQMRLTKHISIIVLLIFVSSCDGTQGDFGRSFEEKFQGAIDELSKSSTPPIEEVKKLSQLEYHMEVFQLEVEPNVVTERLDILGKERWDCFSSFGRPRTEPQKPEMVVICKRTPETMLRYVPRSFIGR
jgi:hypothetical protein